MTSSVALIQPRHCYALPVESGAQGQIYFPTALYHMAARIRSLGVDVSVHDENICSWKGDADVVGLSCIGSPYFPVVASRLSTLAQAGASTLMVGGQGVTGLSSTEFSQLFGAGTINGCIEEQLVVRGILPAAPQSQETSSISSEIANLSDEAFLLYFSAEVPLYLSQGCRFRCSFCAARRSTDANPNVRETYRKLSCVEAELSCIVQRAQELGIRQSKFYLSNLDLFQTPAKVRAFVDCARSILKRWPTHKFLFRGLSTTTSFLATFKKDPKLIEEFVDAGLVQIGFGIDGATPEVWKAIHKPHSKGCLRAVAVARTEFHIIPETLMVFGHDGHDSPHSLSLAVDTVKALSDEFGAIPRPHVAKGLVPGNDGWRAQAGWEKEFMLNHPWAFQFLDFTCLPTDLTHEAEDFRAAVSKAFLTICEMSNCLTQYVLPQDRRLPDAQFERAVLFNRGRFDV